MTPDIMDMDLWEKVKRTVTPLSEAVRASLRKTGLLSPCQRRLDLHGYTLQEAYEQTLSTLQLCAQNGERQLLVITGKGKCGNGALRRELPLWLGAAHLPIASVQQAPIEQGGEGAYIVKLKRSTK